MPSEYVRNLVVGWGVEPWRVSVVRSAVAPVSGEMDRVEARRALGWDPAGRYLVAVARLTAWKGVDRVIDALAGRPDIQLVVVGDGPARRALESRAAFGQIKAVFVGAATRDAVDQYLAAADYLVVYSAYQGLSHTILEAFRAGTPVIASDRGGNPEVIEHDVNGFLAAHPDARALASALARAFEGETQARLSAGARRSASRADWTTAMNAIADLIESAAGDHRAGR